MPREQKTGLSYYSVDTDIFSNRKIKRLLRFKGSEGYLIYSYLLTEVYRDDGYFLKIDENCLFDISDFLNIDEKQITDVINFCCEIGLFNSDIFQKENALTSLNIQDFWVKVSTKARRKNKEVEENLNVKCMFELQTRRKSAPKREDSTLKREESTPKREFSTQSKVKESKEPPNPLLKKQDYSLINFIKNWNELRSHFLKTPSNLNKLNFQERTIFNSEITTFTKKEFHTALNGLFKQEVVPSQIMWVRPKHFLENISTYLDSENNKNYKLYK